MPRAKPVTKSEVMRAICPKSEPGERGIFGDSGGILASLYPKLEPFLISLFGSAVDAIMERYSLNRKDEETAK